MRTEAACEARARAVEIVDIYTELDRIVREAGNQPRRRFCDLPGEAIHRAVTENA